jgi:antitoxin MazE
MARWGNSLAVRIPKPVAEEAGFHEGDRVEVVAKHGRVILKRARNTPTLQELLAKVTPQNIHEETDWGRPVGREKID